jgi:hypothetical protein
MLFLRRLFLLGIGLLAGSALRADQPVHPSLIGLDEIKPGQVGEVWTVFEGTKPEPFQVTVAGIVRNALGPGKSLILCRMSDPRVQKMGAVAGMSGSPMYIQGKLAGALSYQILSFETEHFAGFTPAADLAEVGSRTDLAPDAEPAPTAAVNRAYSPLRPSFVLSGLSPTVAAMMEPSFRAVGLGAVALGGSTASSASAPATAPSTLAPGDAVSVALATGDITMAGTGTVSQMDGTRMVAFGHPMLSLGDVELPMCSAEIVTIIPSALESIKIANTGPIIGTITQDRLSAVSGTLGRVPAMIDVTVQVKSAQPRELHFRVARQAQLSPSIIASGVSQAIMGSNDAGLNRGFRINTDVAYAGQELMTNHALYAGPQAFAAGVGEFVKGLSQDLQNPYEKTFPQRVQFTVEALEENPAVTLNLFQLSRRSAKVGDVVQAQLGWRDYQGAEHTTTVDIPIPPDWAGRNLEVVLAPGPVLDQLSGHPAQIAPSQLRSFEAYLAAMKELRPSDGLYLAVVESAAIFTDQTVGVPELPGSLARPAVAADEARFQTRTALFPLWESHVLAGKLAPVALRRPLKITD